MPENWTMVQSHTSFSTIREEARWKLSEVMNNSEQIAMAPIQIYMLNTVKADLNKDGLVRRYTFGRKDPNKRNRTILMVGETSTGKSTLINMMVNYMLGIKWEDKIRFEIIQDEGEKTQIESKTTAITVYEIFGFEELSVPFSLTVIDTPGFTDRSTLGKDKRITQSLYESLKSGNNIKQIDAVCLVVKASLNRLNPTQKYIFDAILSPFGKNMEKNIMTLITFSSWVSPDNALEAVIESGVPCAKDKNNKHVYFSFNNLPLQKPDKNEKQYKTSWDNGTDSFRAFFQALDEMEKQSLEMTQNVLKRRQSLEASLQSLKSQAEMEKTNRGKLQEAQKTLEELSADMRKNFKDKNNEGKGNEVVTSCFFAVCCRWLWNGPRAVFYWLYRVCCWVVSGFLRRCCGVWRVCCRNHGYQILQDTSETQNEENEVTHHDQKKEAEGRIVAAEADISKLDHELKAIEAEKTKLVEQAIQCIIQLKEIALKFDTDSTRQNILNLIEILEKNNEAEKAKELQKMLEKTVCRRNRHGEDMY